jgi:hypothetical protein
VGSSRARAAPEARWSRESTNSAPGQAAMRRRQAARHPRAAPFLFADQSRSSEAPRRRHHALRLRSHFSEAGFSILDDSGRAVSIPQRISGVSASRDDQQSRYPTAALPVTGTARSSSSSDRRSSGSHYAFSRAHKRVQRVILTGPIRRLRRARTPTASRRSPDGRLRVHGDPAPGRRGRRTDV